MINFFTNVLITAFLLLSSLMAFAKPKLKQFRHDIEIHQNHVVLNGHLIVENFLPFFPLLSNISSKHRYRLVDFYLKMHDTPKLMSLSELKQFGYQDTRSINLKLYSIYGKDVQDSKPEFINELNRIEEQLKADKMIQTFPGLAPTHMPQIMKELEWVEFISDITDTKISRAKELGFKLEKNAAANFFLKLNDIRAAIASEWLEKNHYSLVLNCKKLFE
ncbi:MAG: hypothetical protein WA160_13300 [Pseudobdellovibrio sp.]